MPSQRTNLVFPSVDAIPPHTYPYNGCRSSWSTSSGRPSFAYTHHPFDPSNPPAPIYFYNSPLRPPSYRSSSYTEDPAGGLPMHFTPLPPRAADDTTPSRPRGLLSNMMHLAHLSRHPGLATSTEKDECLLTSRELRRYDSRASIGGLDADDPTITGVKCNKRENQEDLEANCRRTMDLRTMNYKQRRLEAQKIKIVFNITSMLNRRKFILTLARALLTYGAPSHRIESQLVSATRILELDAQFIYLPGLVMVAFGDHESQTSETHVLKCGGKLALGALHEMHTIYRQVVHDEISAKDGTSLLKALLAAPPIYSTFVRCLVAASLSGLICVLSFGGSFLDLWIAATCGGILSVLQLVVVPKNSSYANIFEVTAAMGMSCIARGLSSIRSEIFCYNSIAYGAIVGLLPGFLILTSSLELASKNLLCGSVKMVYALVYALFIGFSLKIGSDLYLHADPSSRNEISTTLSSATRTIVYTGNFVVDTVSNPSLPPMGTFTFMNGTTPAALQDVVNGCYRPGSFPWYLQAFPDWTRYVIVPTYALLSSMKNLQPWRTLDMLVMVVISCVSYTANKIAKHYIFNRSEITSAIGAFVVGMLGNIYSRRFSGTAFTSMVTGVLFLVPNGLSQTGYMDAGNGIEIGTAMINVSVGITVGLFMSQVFVYAVGNSKNAAIFSF